ncbi:class I SAM-dependent methyltransferase [Flavihumibacter petaseus]|nr:class I SAM-dependent methyltransferase [Flavihumibacter petaseus]
MHLSTPAECLDNWFSNDVAFHELYPAVISQLARRHWTPLRVARKAAAFLRTGKEDRVLDIGSGVGKFCLAAAHAEPTVQFTGVELRPWLVEHARIAQQKLGLKNVRFLAANIKDVCFKQFDHFYFYNSFYENLAESEKIDQEMPCSLELFERYSYYLYKQLANRPAGTRLVTYHSLETEIPADFHLVQTEINGYLKYWIKV